MEKPKNEQKEALRSRREFYEKPTIIRHSVGLMNKFGRLSSQIPYGRIDGVAVRDLVGEFGSPLYVVSEGTLRRKYREMLRAFSLRYPRVVVAYSYKTNYLSGICALLHSEGAWAEVVSGFEYDIAEVLGVPGIKIVFNGPSKSKEDLQRAVDNGSRINVDSYDEMYILEEIARSRGSAVPIGIRVNVEVNYPPWDRFGFNYESGQAYDAVKRASSSRLLNVVGIHVHLGTFITDVACYREMAEKIINFCSIIQNELGMKVEYLDLGGGYASMNTLHTQWLPAEQLCPSFDQYAEAICPVLLRGPFKVNEMPLLILEPGRGLVDEAMHVITTVLATKRLPTGQKGVVVDAGVNLIPTTWWYKHEINTAQITGTIAEEVNVYGPLCMQIDALRLGVSLPGLKKGDLLIVKNVGAYNFSQSMQFITPRPAVVLISDEGVEIIRERETMNYVRQLERVPERLRKSGVENSFLNPPSN